jgi:5'-3' exonuclease
MHLDVIDGTYELFRAFFAMPSEVHNGQQVGATRGLIASMLTLLREPEATHVAAATDHVVESFRNRLFAGYKTGEGMDPSLWSQFPLAEEAFSALGIVVWPMIEFEADDALATAAVRWSGDVDQVRILSPDKDLCQCVRDSQVVAVDRRREKIYDAVAVREKFGVPPLLIPDLLALVGDVADGVPGIPGWGMKSASAILNACGALESIPAAAKDWPVTVRGAERLAATLREQREAAALYKTLTTLRVDVPLEQIKIDELRWRGVHQDQFAALCERLGFGALAQRPAQYGLLQQ